jgi:hypothetical protein
MTARTREPFQGALDGHTSESHGSGSNFLPSGANVAGAGLLGLAGAAVPRRPVVQPPLGGFDEQTCIDAKGVTAQATLAAR